MLHKKGDVENVGNYRPICSLPALYKLFSTILYRRLSPRLDQEQAEDQAGFRSSCQTTDHLATYRMLEQKCHEWGIKMWIATIDFTKAFDSITHKSIWKALNSCGINHEYISLLKKVCEDQKASVQTDVESNMFEIKKGTKQGDLLSSLLFNTVLQNSLKDDIQRWQKKKGMGIYLSDCEVRRRRAFCSQHPKNSFKKCCASSRKVLKKCVSGSTQTLNSKSWQEEKAWDTWPTDYVPASGNDRNQESYQDSLGDIPQVQAEADIEKLIAQTPSPTVRRSDNSDDMLRIGNIGTHQRAWKNDTIDAMQDAPTHHTNRKKIQKDRETQSYEQRRLKRHWLELHLRRERRRKKRHISQWPRQWRVIRD